MNFFMGSLYQENFLYLLCNFQTLDFILESESSQIDVLVLTKEKKKTVVSVENLTVTG